MQKLTRSREIVQPISPSCRYYQKAALVSDRLKSCAFFSERASQLLASSLDAFFARIQQPVPPFGRSLGQVGTKGSAVLQAATTLKAWRGGTAQAA